MEFSAQDKSNYLKGLLVIAKKDKMLTPEEIDHIKAIASSLGFAKDFYEGALFTLLQNEYLSEEPIIFSDKKAAESFIIEGLKLAKCDHVMVDSEREYLKSIILANNLDEKLLED